MPNPRWVIKSADVDVFGSLKNNLDRGSSTLDSRSVTISQYDIGRNK